MARQVSVNAETFPIAGRFTIARGSKTQAEVVVCSIAEGGAVGRGECVPYRRYGETIEGVMTAIEEERKVIEGGVDRAALLCAMPEGAARCAIDCALWDLEAKQSGVSVATRLGLTQPRALETAFTISLGEPATMAADAARNARRPLLKVKVGTEDDVERMRAVVVAAPKSRIILDANEGWRAFNLERHLTEAARLGIALVEQPLPVGEDAALATMRGLVPICADESAHGLGDIADLRDRYDAINIKLDKTGGLTAALALRDHAKMLGFKIMVGCMVGTSLGMAPAVLLAQSADFVDLDGPLLLARDREPGLIYEGSMVSPPTPDLWG